MSGTILLSRRFDEEDPRSVIDVEVDLRIQISGIVSLEPVSYGFSASFVNVLLRGDSPMSLMPGTVGLVVILRVLPIAEHSVIRFIDGVFLR